MKWLATIFILIPTAELALLIYSGQIIGLFPTLAIILITGIGGAYLTKRQGLKAWRDLNRRMTLMETPGDALIDGVCIFIGGILLLIPGYFTDIVGLLLMFSWPRQLIRPFIHRWIFKKMGNSKVIMM